MENFLGQPLTTCPKFGTMSLVSQAAAMLGLAKASSPAQEVGPLSSRLRESPATETDAGRIDSTGVADPAGNSDVTPTADNRYRDDQWQLWIDNVGGYLVCLANEIELGQPGGETSDLVDPAKGASRTKIGILGDLSRQHARLRRDRGDYLLLPASDSTVDGRTVEGPTLLASGARIVLGEQVELEFRKPHALSASALLRVVSGQRTDPSADAIVLMAESLVLGPKSHSHLRCSDWEEEVLLFRGSSGLQCRSSAKIVHNGTPLEGSPAVLRPGSRVEGQDFRFSVEGVLKSQSS